MRLAGICSLLFVQSFLICVESRAQAASGSGQKQTVDDTQPAHAKRTEPKSASTGRPMMPGDLSSIRKYDVVKVSPDALMVAIETSEYVPGVSSGTFFTNQRKELWVATRDGQERQRLTPEQPIRVSQWNPIWSPNSQQLAFLSNEGGGGAFLELWDRASGRVRRLTTTDVDLGASISQSLSSANQNQMLWLDDTHLLALVLPSGFPSPIIDYVIKSTRIPGIGVDTAAEGLKPTAIVATSPPHPSDTRDFPQAQVVIFDTKTGTSSSTADIPVWPSVNSHRYIVVSSNGEWGAFVTTIPVGALYAESKMSPRQFVWTKLGVMSLGEHGPGVRWVEGLQPALVNGTETTIRWQDGDKSFAVVGQQPEPGQQPYLALVEMPTAKWRSIAVLDEHRLGTDERMEILGIAWLEDGRVAVRVHHPRTTDDTLRKTWWAVSGESATRLTKEEVALLSEGNRADPNDAANLETSETGRLYEKNATGQEATIFPDLNPQLAEIESPRVMNFEYKSASGEVLHANLLLPRGYVEGKRYPTVVWVYAGDMHGPDEKPPRRDSSSFTNPLILSGHGYAVLTPSMPLTYAGIPGDPMLHLNDGVDPAIDRAVQLGIVDPDRLAVMGHSYGGYSVFGLLTETHRYRAAVALMGISDLALMYGEFASFQRYTDPELAANLGPEFGEWEQLRMGVPPWVDPDRYIRNSPFFAADKITTPVLIFSGDLDNLPTQSEAMFTALRRQAKRAEYVRYLGEAHWPASPANVKDMWQRIFSWLDTYLKNSPVTGRE
jgi:dipeptidyl aminopeptidase/acylaminoacyl peptidase